MTVVVVARTAEGHEAAVVVGNPPLGRGRAALGIAGRHARPGLRRVVSPTGDEFTVIRHRTTWLDRYRAQFDWSLARFALVLTVAVLLLAEVGR